jgi:SSS family solute:Na+ symporter
VQLGFIDIATFILFIVVVVAVSLYASRKEDSSEDYFLAGRKLTWWLIGFSLIASNISTEHFVGMAGSAFGSFGLAVASYEWIAAITLVIVAWWLLPKFLKAGIYTMPQFLEYRYNESSRTIMSVYLMVLTVIAVLVTVLYSGSRGLDGVFNFSGMVANWLNLPVDSTDPVVQQEAIAKARFIATWGGAWLIGIIAAAYTIYGGLKAVVWSDLIQGAALMLGGAIVLYFGLKLLGGGTLLENGGVSGGDIAQGWSSFKAANADKLHTMKPADDPELPWTAMLLGIWIPNFFYWGLNQFITQRTLGARSLADGQRGIFLACVMKLIIPFIIVIPGIIAFQKFGAEILANAGGDEAKAGELAYPYLIREIMPPMLRGVMLAALAGAVMSTFNSGINSAATLFTVDVWQKFFKPEATAKQQVKVGRITTALIALAACLMAPLPGLFQGVFNYIQEIWGFISPAIVAAFFFGLLLPRAPRITGQIALLVGPLVYSIFRIPGWIMKGMGYFIGEEDAVLRGGTDPQVVEGASAALFKFTQMPYLHHMAFTLIILFVIMLVMSLVKPRRDPLTMPESNIDLRPDPLRYVFGGLILAATVVLYIIFW